MFANCTTRHHHIGSCAVITGNLTLLICKIHEYRVSKSFTLFKKCQYTVCRHSMKIQHSLNLCAEDCDEIWHTYWSHNQTSLHIFFSFQVVLKYTVLKITSPPPNGGKREITARLSFNNSFENGETIKSTLYSLTKFSL